MIAAGFIIQLFIIVSVIYISGGRVLFFFDIISLIFDFAILFTVLLFTGAIKPFIKGWGFVLVRERSGSRAEIDACVDSWDLAVKTLLSAGLTGFLIGLILMLVNLNEPAQVGPYLAIALITIFYATVFILLFLIPGRYVLLRKMKECC